jgi:NAD+ kinase
MTQRVVGIVYHSDRSAIEHITQGLLEALATRDIRAIEVDAAIVAGSELSQAELIVVLGGDGTMLKAVEYSFEIDIPILGVNLGRVGFLAEAEPSDVDTVVDFIDRKSWSTEERICVQADVIRNNQSVFKSFALNEVSIEKTQRDLMTELRISVDSSPLMTWAGDGIVISTPTGSTAYAFSAGGPVIWPTANVLLAVPISAHALFARPIVVSPDSSISAEVISASATATFDGRRYFDLIEGDCVVVTKAAHAVRFARVHDTSFTQRLVAKFRLPTVGWREQRADID